jgi:DNA-binding transcriptional MocR family regulator
MPSPVARVPVLWPRDGVSETEVIDCAARNDVGVYGVSRYFLGRRKQAGVMLGFARLNEARIRAGVRSLASAWPRARSTRK